LFTFIIFSVQRGRNLHPFLLKTPAYSSIRIGIILKLPKKCVVVFTNKDIGAGLYCPLVGYLVVDFRSDISILIRGGIIGKQRQPQVLVHQQFGQTQGQNMTELILGRRACRKRAFVGFIFLHPFQIVLEAAGKIRSQFPLKTG
jgi:hypothetical protein